MSHNTTELCQDRAQIRISIINSFQILGLDTTSLCRWLVKEIEIDNNKILELPNPNERNRLITRIANNQVFLHILSEKTLSFNNNLKMKVVK